MLFTEISLSTKSYGIAVTLCHCMYLMHRVVSGLDIIQDLARLAHTLRLI